MGVRIFSKSLARDQAPRRTHHRDRRQPRTRPRTLPPRRGPLGSATPARPQPMLREPHSGTPARRVLVRTPPAARILCYSPMLTDRSACIHTHACMQVSPAAGRSVLLRRAAALKPYAATTYGGATRNEKTFRPANSRRDTRSRARVPWTTTSRRSHTISRLRWK